MPRIPIFRLGGAPDKPAPPNLAASTPFVSLDGISVGVDNLRHDVVLSTKFVELARAHIARLIARHGELEGLLSAESTRGCTGSFVDDAPGGKTCGAQERSRRVESGADRTAGRIPQSGQKRIQAVGGSAGAAGGHQVSARRNESAVFAGAGALPRADQELRQHAAGQGARVPRAAGGLPGAEKNHPAQGGAGNL